MRIVLLSSASSIINPLPLISASLKGQIKGVEVKEIICDSNLDLASEILHAKGDAVAAILFYGEESADVVLVMQKIVERDSKGKPVLKFLRKGEDFDENEEADIISRSILAKLFGKEKTSVNERGSYKGLES